MLISPAWSSRSMQRHSTSASASRNVTCERLMRSGSSAAGACVMRIMGPGPR